MIQSHLGIENFNPTGFISTLTDNLDALPDAFWMELENTILDVIEGKDEASDKVVRLLRLHED